MIPAFDADGFLPPGVHRATLAEIRDRFGGPSEIRRAQMESISWMIDLAARAGVVRIVLNGSFVTNRMEPNDVDCVLLIERQRHDRDQGMELKDDIDLANTREKLREFQARYRARQQETPQDEHVHRLTLMSLKRVINQLIEDIARYESRLHRV